MGRKVMINKNSCLASLTNFQRWVGANSLIYTCNFAKFIKSSERLDCNKLSINEGETLEIWVIFTRKLNM